MSKKLFGFFLTLWWEIRINTSAAMNSNSPTSHDVFLCFNLFALILFCERERERESVMKNSNNVGGVFIGKVC
jgi:hypothetical protein